MLIHTDTLSQGGDLNSSKIIHLKIVIQSERSNYLKISMTFYKEKYGKASYKPFDIDRVFLIRSEMLANVHLLLEIDK